MVLDREIFHVSNELRLLRDNPDRNSRVGDDSYSPPRFENEPPVQLDDERGLYVHDERLMVFLERARRGDFSITEIPLGTPLYIIDFICSH